MRRSATGLPVHTQLPATRWRSLMGLLAAHALTMGAAAPGSAQTSAQIPPVRQLGRIEAVTKEPLADVGGIRPLSDGRVLLIDRQGKRVVLFDSSLQHVTVVADTTSGTAKAYGGRGGTILPYKGDTSVFADNASLAMLIIEPDGKLGRAVAAPRGPGGGLPYLAGAYVDPTGHVLSVWNSAAAGRLGGAGARGAAVPSAAPQASGTTQRTTDSSVILRVEIESKHVDSVGWLTPTTQTYYTSTGPAGGIRREFIDNPMQLNDAWTMMPDGTVAIVRELDYHVDWFAPDRPKVSTPRIPHQWEHVTDSMKAVMLDSIKHADTLSAIRELAFYDSLGKAGGLPPGFKVAMSDLLSQFVDASELPDYYPAFAQPDSLGNGIVKGDCEGNLWIRVSGVKGPGGGPVFDIVNREGKLIDRVQIPGGTRLTGFGPGVAYLSSREGSGYVLARAKIH